MIKVGVTGSNGFMGWHLSRWLEIRKSEFSIVPFQREFFQDKERLKDFVSQCDAIIHLAGINRSDSEDYIYEKNLELSDRLISSFIKSKYQGILIFASSVHESSNTAYGRSKKESSEKFLKWADENDGIAKCLIMPNAFGPFG